MGVGYVCLHGTEVYGYQALPSSLLSAVGACYPSSQYNAGTYLTLQVCVDIGHRVGGGVGANSQVCVNIGQLYVYVGGMFVCVCASMAVWCLSVDVGLSFCLHNVTNSIIEIPSPTAAASGR